MEYNRLYKPERTETLDLLDGIDQFANAMKQAIIQKEKEGSKGWQENTLKQCLYEAARHIEIIESDSNESKRAIAAANWLAIFWLNNRK